VSGSGTEPILRAYKITVDDASRVYVFKPTLNGSDEKRRSRRETVWLTRIWYKKYWMNCFSNGREVSSR